MSGKPADISQDVWDDAERMFWDDPSCAFNASGFADDVVSVIARAIMAERLRWEQRRTDPDGCIKP